MKQKNALLSPPKDFLSPAGTVAVFVYLLFVILPVNAAYAQTFRGFISRVQNASDSLSRNRSIDDYLGHHLVPIVEDSVVHFIYRGKGNVVAVPGEINGWDPPKAVMTRVRGTDLFYHTDTVPVDGRVEYKLWIDSVWRLDSLNPRRAMGGFGDNSDVWMPEYNPSLWTPDSNGVVVGRLDTLWIESEYLHLKHPVIVYVPTIPRRETDDALPLLLVMDGVDYLTFAKMHLMIDNLLSTNRIQPVVAAFVEPRTGLHVDSTNRRMTEYAANDSYLDFLQMEVVPHLEQSYMVSRDPDKRLIMGASMGGLISTYAVLKRPAFVGNCAAQSPAYRQADSAVIRLVRNIYHTSARVYIQTGTIHDTGTEARYVYESIREKGARITYEEFHEGHNWTNWRTHMSDILEFFFPTK